jgi:hypothetical protein
MKIKKFVIKQTDKRNQTANYKCQLFDFFTDKNFTIISWIPASSGLKVELFGDKSSFKSLSNDFAREFGIYLKIKRVWF